MKNLQGLKPFAVDDSPEGLIDELLSHFPKVVSPRAHAIFDLMVFPTMLPLVIYLAKRNPRAGAIMGLNMAVEGGVSFFTDYPPAVVPLISFQNHIRIGMVFAPLSTVLALLMPGLTKRQRILLSLMPIIPFVLNGLSKPVAK